MKVPFKSKSLKVKSKDGTFGLTLSRVHIGVLDEG